MNEQQIMELMTTMAAVYEEIAPELAQAEWAYYQALQDAGFSEDQAFELVKRMDDMGMSVSQ